jgi:hypothetical protein
MNPALQLRIATNSSSFANEAAEMEKGAEAFRLRASVFPAGDCLTAQSPSL